MTSTTLPGSFFSDLDLTLDNTPNPAVGARSHFFQPPHTPSASSSLCRDIDTDTASTTTMSTTITTSSRKRVRQEYPDSSWSSDFITAGCASPAPFVNTKYRLAGGLDTSMAAEEEAREEGSRYYSDVGYRRAWTGAEVSPMGSVGYIGGSGGGARVESGGGGAWSKTVLDVVGGVAGKVWEFCKASAFRGFYAGGGAGYQIRSAPASRREDDEDERFWQDLDPTTATNNNNNLATPLTPTPLHHARSRSSTPIPGQFPLDDDYYIPPSPLPRPAKRVLRDKGGGELKVGWVMVPTPESGGRKREKRTSSTATVVGMGGRSSKRGTPVASTAGVGAPGRRRVATAHSQHAHRPTPPTTASSRASVAATTTTTTTTTPTPSSTTASYASPRHTPTTTPNPLIARRLREEREADRSIQRFNERLKNMIREGKEALGSRWDVELEDEEQEAVGAEEVF